ncbi:TRAP transporter small permease [Bosea sp. F3-2]|uniref:TRAP transporter small permease n=1 Tax=Bosea sp. F3-2 TaxID=2599640 RepID=UPI0011EFD3C0|nr:TRAP transporter small permease [Bosea sp. F3-2]QEL24068.1 TRAP transporter small permease [Bosea sp. F3-2]
MHAFTLALSRLSARLTLIVLALAGLGILLMTALIAWGVFGRFILNDTPTWVEAGSLLLMAWFIFLGAAVGVRESDHLGFEGLLAFIPRRLEAALVVFTQILILGFGIAMVIYGLQLVEKGWSDRIPLIGIAKSWDYVPLVIGGVLITFFSVERLLLIATGVPRVPLRIKAERAGGGEL